MSRLNSKVVVAVVVLGIVLVGFYSSDLKSTMDKANVPEEDFGATVHKYENFVDDVLRKDLDAAVKAMDKTYLAYGETYGFDYRCGSF